MSAWQDRCDAHLKYEPPRLLAIDVDAQIFDIPRDLSAAVKRVGRFPQATLRQDLVRVTGLSRRPRQACVKKPKWPFLKERFSIDLAGVDLVFLGQFIGRLLAG